jgi:hypothetical protein
MKLKGLLLKVYIYNSFLQNEIHIVEADMNHFPVSIIHES